jgi:hypothetical protein
VVALLKRRVEKNLNLFSSSYHEQTYEPRVAISTGCKPSTCPKGDPAAQKEHADRQAERERANAQRAARPFQGAVDVGEDEAVSDEENAEQCLMSSHVPPNLPRNNPELSPKCFLDCWELSATIYRVLMVHQPSLHALP